MILESWPWKRQLLRDADIIERWVQKKPSERRRFTIEQKIFLSAYSMRKLFDGQKFSSSFGERVLKCTVYPPLGKRITIANNHRLDELYDLHSPSSKNISATILLNLIIHSFIFFEVVDDGLTLQSFFVTSDQSRQQGLWQITLAEFTRLMRIVGNDMPSRYIRVFDKKQGDWFIWQGDGDPPKHIAEKIKRLKE